MSGHRWSLAGRMRAWFALTTAGIVLVLSAASGWVFVQSVAHEIDALAGEELTEFRALYSASDRDLASLRRIEADLASQHPDVPMSWRIREPEGGPVVLELGPESLARHAPGGSPEPGAAVAEDHPVDLGGGLRWSTTTLDDGRHLDLLLDGSHRLKLLRRLGVTAAVFVGLVLFAGLLFGELFCRRVSGLLLRVAEKVREVRNLSGEAPVQVREVERAPDEVRAVAEALADLLENVRAGTERARLMTAGLAHELRSPIQNLIGETEVGLLTERAPAEYRRVLESHLEELRSLGDAVDNLVSLCSQDQQTGPPPAEDFDLASEAEIRLQREREIAARHGVDLRVSHTGPMQVRGDREALLRALRNLTANAVEWSEPGGRVEVALEGVGDELTITVDDGGPGIPEAERERIFEPFYRGRSVQGQRVGYGLGLALTRQAVAAGGGTIEVGRSPAGGARFRIVLPRGGSPEREHAA